MAVIATLGIVVAAVYGLYLMQRSFQGTPNPDVASMRDFGLREMSVMAAMMVALVWVGIYPQHVLELSSATIDAMGVLP